MNATLWIGAGWLVLVAVCLIAVVLVMALVLNRPRRPRAPGPAIPITEEAATGVENKPWSPTRGFYFFAASDFPPEYQALPGLELAAVKQFGEDEADALAQLNARMGRRYFDELRKVAPKIASTPIRFQALNKRKKDRTP